MIFFETIANGEIDNRSLSLEDLKNKFQEECYETFEAFSFYIEDPERGKLLDLLGEMFDVIQVIIAINCKIKLRTKDYDKILKSGYMQHIDKLRRRNWTMKGIFKAGEIDEDIQIILKENESLRTLLTDSLKIIDGYKNKSKHWEDHYKELNRFCELKGV